MTSAAFAAADTAAPLQPTTRAEVKASGAADAETKDASGKTEMNREGKMSLTGQNETSSVAPKKQESSMPGTTAMQKRNMGEAGGRTMDASGKTEANREGRMSPRHENATISVVPKQSGTAIK